MDLITSFYETDKGEFVTVEGRYVTWNKDTCEFEEGEPFEDVDTYYVNDLEMMSMNEYAEKITEFTELEDGEFIKISFVPRRWAQFTYNNKDEHYEDAEYGDACGGVDEFIYDGYCVFTEDQYVGE